MVFSTLSLPFLQIGGKTLNSFQSKILCCLRSSASNILLRWQNSVNTPNARRMAEHSTLLR